MLVGLAKKKVMVAVGPFILLVSIYSDDASPCLFLYRYIKSQHWRRNLNIEPTAEQSQTPTAWSFGAPTAELSSLDAGLPLVIEKWAGMEFSKAGYHEHGDPNGHGHPHNRCLITARSPAHDYLLRLWWVRYDKEIEIGEIQDENSFVIKDHEKLIF